MKLVKIITNTFQGGELSNEAYHLHPGISGTGLSKIWEKSVKAFLETKRKPSDALGFGIASHAAFLEPHLFANEFYCGFDASLYPNAMRTQNDFKEYLSKAGLKVSGSKADQIKRIKDHAAEVEQNVQIIDEMKSEWDAKNKGKVEVSPKDFAQLNKMRDRIIQDADVSGVLSGAAIERSIIAEVDYFEELSNPGDANKGQFIICVKIRPDILSTRLSLVDYKTCTDCFDKFEREIFKFNYDLKMALQHDIINLVFGRKPQVILLAQDKLMPSEESNPHEYCPWFLDDTVLENGRKKYLVALKRWAEYKETGVAVGKGNQGRYANMNKWDEV